MGTAMLTPWLVALFRKGGWYGLGLLMAALVWAQRPAPPPPPPGPPGPDGPGPKMAERLPDLRKRVDATKAVNETAARALQYSRAFLGSAETALRARRSFAADRLAEAADALLHVAEHQQHLQTGGGPHGPPPTGDIHDHLQRVYFRTRQAEYFFRQSHDPRAASFPKWARDFYQIAVRAYDNNDLLAADENAKCADEVVKALENLAQAATPANIPPPPPGPPVP